MKILVFCRFLDQIRLQKTVFWTNTKKMFFSIQYLNILQFIKLLLTPCAFCFIKKIINDCKSIFHECERK